MFDALSVLVFLMRFAGGVMLLAFFAVFLPLEWMATSHRMLGLGPFPEPSAPLVPYLTRCISLLYGIHGGLLIVLAADVVHYARIIRYVASMHILFGIVVLGIDIHSGMPWYWTLGEGPPVAVLAVVMLVLLRSVEKA